MRMEKKKQNRRERGKGQQVLSLVDIELFRQVFIGTADTEKEFLVLPRTDEDRERHSRSPFGKDVGEHLAANEGEL